MTLAKPDLHNLPPPEPLDPAAAYAMGNLLALFRLATPVATWNRPVIDARRMK